MAATFHIDPLTHLRSTEADRYVRLAAAMWWQDQREQAAKAAQSK